MEDLRGYRFVRSGSEALSAGRSFALPLIFEGLALWLDGRRLVSLEVDCGASPTWLIPD
jgi:hypothetical protein